MTRPTKPDGLVIDRGHHKKGMTKAYLAKVAAEMKSEKPLIGGLRGESRKKTTARKRSSPPPVDRT